METTLETLISRGAVDGRLLTLLQQSLPDRLDDVPDGFRLTARDVAHCPRLCRRCNHRQRNVAVGTRTQ